MATAIRNTQVSDAEWEARQQLAACYRVFDMLGWSEMIYNHITLKVPGEDGAFLINPFGLHFSEVTARSEEHTSEPVTNAHLVCRLRLEKKQKHNDNIPDD